MQYQVVSVLYIAYYFFKISLSDEAILSISSWLCPISLRISSGGSRTSLSPSFGFLGEISYPRSFICSIGTIHKLSDTSRFSHLLRIYTKCSSRIFCFLVNLPFNSPYQISFVAPVLSKKTRFVFTPAPISVNTPWGSEIMVCTLHFSKSS